MADLYQRMTKEQKLQALLFFIIGSESWDFWLSARPSVRRMQHKITQSGLEGYIRSLNRQQMDAFLEEIQYSTRDRRFFDQAEYVTEDYSSRLAQRLARQHREFQIIPENKDLKKDFAGGFLKEWQVKRDSVTDLTGNVSRVEASAKDWLRGYHEVEVESYWQIDLFSENSWETCLGLSDTHESVWKDEFPFGPPAHPFCRCCLRYFNVLSSLDGDFSMNFYQREESKNPLAGRHERTGNRY